jgi:hypothetical protein
MVHVDGEGRGPVVRTSVPSVVAPSYASGGRALITSTVLGSHDDGATERHVRAHLGVIYGCDTRAWQHVATYAVEHAIPAAPPPLDDNRAPGVGDGLYVAGDHWSTGSATGALTSGRRAAEAVLHDLGA